MAIELIETIDVTANDPAVDWTALLSANALATLYDESRIQLVFRAGRSAAVYLRTVAADDAQEAEIPEDTGHGVHPTTDYGAGGWRWKHAPRYLYAAAPVNVTIEVYRQRQA